MKKIIFIINSLIFTLVCSAQTINVHKTHGEIVVFQLSDVEYIDFTLSSPEQDENTPAGLEVIDLGLPSGTLWASMNIGATKPEEKGDYYSWGETEIKSFYNWSNYSYCNGTRETCKEIGSDIGGTKYDVAREKWGGSWRIPTIEDIDELCNNCLSQWITINGITGRQFTGPNGKTVFFPAAGRRWEYDTILPSVGVYWSSTAGNDGATPTLLFGSGNSGGRGNDERARGILVRPVKHTK